MNPRIRLAVSIAVAAVVCLCIGGVNPFAAGLGLLALGAIVAPNVRDANIGTSDALPNGATHIHTTAIDLGTSSRAAFDGGQKVELLIEAPALTTGQLGDGNTMTYEVYHDTDSAFGTEVSVYGGPNLTQTGAAGAGAAATRKRVALPTDVKRYVRVKVTNSAAGNASTVKVAVNLVF